MPGSATASGSGSGLLTDAELWDVDYVDKEHSEAFARALSTPDVLTEGDATPSSPRSPSISLDPTDKWQYGPENGSLGQQGREHGGEGRRGRVEKLSATSDFAPIHQRVSRRHTKSAQQGITYHLMRWPLLWFIFFIISMEFGAYVVTRQVVNVFEYLVAWRGHKSTLRSELRKAQTYEDWVKAAKKLDEYLGFDEWKETEEDGYFDWTLVKRVDRTLRRMRSAKDFRGLMDALAVCVRSNFAGTEGVKMYSETFHGTKRVVEAHVNEVAACLDSIRTSTDVSLEEKRAFFRAVNKNYGSSALCLSGGASFGYYHFGVIKAFLEADLLPRVITGTSAGGLVAALLCTRTNDELKQLLVPRLADKITACSDPFRVWFRRFRETGARFDSVEWAQKATFFTRGSLTFKEAYERTGRALNVSVVPSDRHSPTILLNHLTAPNCVIWSAILASAAVPGILNSVVLMAKDRNGQIKPHNLGGSRFKDGSLREDIPLGSLHTQFNCNFSIVSQTNPHIHLFFFAPRGSVGRPVAHRKGKGWRGGFILSALESYIKLDLTKHFKVIRDLDLLPQLLQSDWSGVFLQRFSGDLTLTPRSTLGDWFRILSDPNRSQLERMFDVGQKVAWPALHMVRNRMIIERAILRGRTEVRAALHRDRTTIDPEHVREPSSDREKRMVDGLPGGLTIQVPIESDADAGFLQRSKKAKSHRGLAAPPGAYQQNNPLRRRRGGAVASGGNGSGSSSRRPFPAAAGLEPPRRGHTTEQPARRSSTPGLSREDRRRAVSEQHETTPVRAQDPRGYTATIGDTLRHVRTSSISAFTSPFRSKASLNTAANAGDRDRAGSTPEDSGNENHRRRSQRSISRWFGGISESSTSDEAEDDGELGRYGNLVNVNGTNGGSHAYGHSRTRSNGSTEDDDTPRFSQRRVLGLSEGEGEGDDGLDEEVLVEDPDSASDIEETREGSAGDGRIPIPGGERVRQRDIDATAAAGQRLRVADSQSQRTPQYSPPQQDQ